MVPMRRRRALLRQLARALALVAKQLRAGRANQKIRVLAAGQSSRHCRAPGRDSMIDTLAWLGAGALCGALIIVALLISI